MVSSQTVANTTAPTTLFNTSGALGSLQIPANYLQSGTYIKIYLSGTIGTLVTVPLITLTPIFGATSLISVAVTPAAQLVGPVFFECTTTIQCQSAGSSGSALTSSVMWLNSLVQTALSASPSVATINTTVASNLDFQITWGTANPANTITVYTGYVEVIG
jgi:hypothetical protein